MLAVPAWTAIGAVFALPTWQTATGRRTLLGSLTNGGAGDWWSTSLWLPIADFPSPSGNFPSVLRSRAAQLIPFFHVDLRFTLRRRRGLALFGLERCSMVPHAQVRRARCMGFSCGAGWSYWMILAAQVHQYYDGSVSSELLREQIGGKFSRCP